MELHNVYWISLIIWYAKAVSKVFTFFSDLSLIRDILWFLGLDVIKVDTANPIMIHIFEKQGFECLVKLPYCDNKIDGKPVIDEKTELCLYVKDLRKEKAKDWSCGSGGNKSFTSSVYIIFYWGGVHSFIVCGTFRYENSCSSLRVCSLSFNRLTSFCQ